MTPVRSRSAWQRLAPRFAATEVDRILDDIDTYLADPATVAELAALDAADRYPETVLAGLYRRGMAQLFVPDRASAPHLSAVNAATARLSGSLAITVGVTGLALLPVYLAGSAAQRAEVSARLHGGARAAMLLTELNHGSNLLRNEAAAHADGDGFVLTGEKHLVNGGTRHDLLVALLRTGEPGEAADRTRDFTLFLVERDPTVRPLARWRTLPARGADISGVRFEQTKVPATAVIGTVGGGFALVQRTLAMSHAGVSALAAGAATGARELAEGYARGRDVYGEPIVRLGAVSDHLVRMAALDLVVSALAVKAAYAVNRHGSAAGYLTAAAKYACCRLAGVAVDEGRTALGARALLEDVGYAPYVRDVLLYSVFDGTSHLMLDQLSAHLVRQSARTATRTLDATRRLYTTAPVPIVDAPRTAVPYGSPLAARCAGLAEATGSAQADYLARLAGALYSVTRAARQTGLWAADQGWRFDAAAVLAELEALLAACELATAGCRQELGIDGMVSANDEAASAYAVIWLGGKLAHRLHELAGRVGAEAAAAMPRQGDLTPPEGRQRAETRLRAAAAGDALDQSVL